MRQLTVSLRVVLLTCVLLTSIPGRGDAANGLPDVDVVVIAEVQDTAGWLTMHQEVLSTSAASTKVLRATLPARTGGSRSIDIEQPRFTVRLVTAQGQPQVRVTVAGKVPASLALAVVTPFQQAAMEIQAGRMTNEISLGYSLSIVGGRLLELYFDRP